MPRVLARGHPGRLGASPWRRPIASCPVSASCTTLPASRLFPSIFAPLLARLRPAHAGLPAKSLWLPGPDNGLIIPELADAAQALGLTPRPPGRLSPQELARSGTGTARTCS
jgi:hypothetical protein